MFPKFPLFSVLALSVAACSGGGGSSAPDTSFKGFSKLPDDGTTDFVGQAVTGDYTVDEGEVRLSNLSPRSNVTAQLTTEGGERVVLVIEAAGASVTFDTGAGDTRTTSDGIVVYESASGEELAVIADEEDAGFEYQTHGSWITGLGTDEGSFGSASYGLRTSASNLPSSDATYSGQAFGIAEINEELFATVSNVNLNTDFNNVSIQSFGTTIESIESPDGTASADYLNYFAVAEQLNGSAFTAALLGTDVSGSVQGQFYGPAAEEVGGTFTAVGRGGSSGVTVYRGSIGAIEDDF